jgi:glutamate-5-semialdehyde dehydrogenase
MIESVLRQRLSLAQCAVRDLRRFDPDEVLNEIADELIAGAPAILKANATDMAGLDKSNPKYDRLYLNDRRIETMAKNMRAVAAIKFNYKQTISVDERPNGLQIRKETTPFGVVAVIYEARPNVTTDVFALCFKSRNACVLKGSKDADNTNKALVEIIRNVLSRRSISTYACTYIRPEREYIDALLKMPEYIDLVIPRGGKSLIDHVRKHSLIPVIETGAGVCHIYYDKAGDKEKAREIIYNAKTRRVSVCNALDCLIIHPNKLDELPYICGKLSWKEVVIYADPQAYEVLEGNYPEELLKRATKDKYGMEFLDYKMSIVTGPILYAQRHINEYGSRHSEGIITEDPDAINEFADTVDAACIYSNASISFTDGGEFGFGAEIGISTQKLHARGPMGLNELLTYKYVITGNGQTRPE